MRADTDQIPDGLVAVVKRDCPTCELVAPVLVELAERGIDLTVYSQDDPSFPPGVKAVVDDIDLSVSYRLGVTTVPTLLRVSGGAEADRVEGWRRDQWETMTGQIGLGAGLPEYRPGCGSRTLDPGVADTLAVRFGGWRLGARRGERAGPEGGPRAEFRRGGGGGAA